MVVLEAACRRLAVKEGNALRKAPDTDKPEGWMPNLSTDHAGLVERELGPVYDAIAAAGGRALTPAERSKALNSYLGGLQADSAKLWTTRAGLDLDSWVELRLASARGTLLPKLIELLSASPSPSSAS